MIESTIPMTNLAGLQEQVEKLNKRANKLGLQPLGLTLGEPFWKVIQTPNDELGFPEKRQFVTVTLEGEEPRLEGWRMLAAVTRLENGENLLRVVPGCEVPEMYRETDTGCDHCHKTRRRNDVFVLLHEDGRHCQVGRQCLGDFLGTVSPEQMINRAECLWDASKILSDAEDDDWEYGERRADRLAGMSILEYLTVVAACIRALGWISKANAEIKMKPSTHDDVSTVLFDRKSEETQRWIRKHEILPVTERDEKMAADALAWAQALPRSGGSEYLYNLGVAARQEHVDSRCAGLLCSIIGSYQRTLEEERQKAGEGRTESQWQGEIGKRQVFDLTLVMNRQFEGNYGVSTIAKFEDAAGNVFVWHASGNPDWLHDLNGSPVPIKATVKKHDEYRGVRQTTLARAALAK